MRQLTKESYLELKDYILHALHYDYSLKEIKKMLLNSNWQKEDIKQAIEEIKSDSIPKFKFDKLNEDYKKIADKY